MTKQDWVALITTILHNYPSFGEWIESEDSIEFVDALAERICQR